MVREIITTYFDPGRIAVFRGRRSGCDTIFAPAGPWCRFPLLRWSPSGGLLERRHGSRIAGNRYPGNVSGQLGEALSFSASDNPALRHTLAERANIGTHYTVQYWNMKKTHGTQTAHEAAPKISLEKTAKIIKNNPQ
jgi:hypothetical protein